jgi:4a-hydroxytetrahydrobiopterin dehydratase
MPEPLSADALATTLAGLRGWSGGSGGLLRTWRFPSFTAAMAFMHACTPRIDTLDHHPEWSNVYDKVSVRLATHDAGNRVTALDVQLATLLDEQARIHCGS